MKPYIKLPLKLQEINEKSKFKQIYTYFLIKCRIYDDSLTASVLQGKLMQEVCVSSKTMQTYIQNLKPYFSCITKEYIDKCDHYCNKYHFTNITRYYIAVNKDLKDDTNLTPEQKGILIKIKMMCIKNTNYIKYDSKTELKEILDISKNRVHSILEDLEKKGYICFIGKSLHLTQKYFPLSLDDMDIENYIYKVIYNYCLVNKVCPPLRDNKALNYLITKFPNIDDSFAEILAKKCPTLPADISLDYFVKALTDNNINRTKQTCTFIL